MSYQILVVEDDLTLRDTVEYNLRNQGYAVITAENGYRALDLARAGAPDLILLDLMLPGINGFEVCRILRREMSVPILMLTARTEEVDKIIGLEVGADDYLTKPFAFAELLARVRALLRRGAAQVSGRASTLRVADLELDRLSQQVRRAGRRIELTGKEYALLEYLMSNAGRVLSRTMIIEHVWDQSFDGATNIVDVYVRHLRNKIDEGRERKLIRTVRGVGYAISDGEGE